MKPIINAFLSAVGISVLVTFVLFGIAEIQSEYRTITFPLIAAISAWFTAIISVLIWGIPVHLLLQSRRMTKLYWYLLTSLAPSAVFVFGFKPFGHDNLQTLLGQFLFCGLVGLISSATFWWVAVHKQKSTKDKEGS